MQTNKSYALCCESKTQPFRSYCKDSKQPTLKAEAALYDAAVLDTVIGLIDDIDLLGSAIFFKWRSTILLAFRSVRPGVGVTIGKTESSEVCDAPCMLAGGPKSLSQACGSRHVSNGLAETKDWSAGETMVGTIANTLSIVVGSLVGGTVRHGLKEKYQDILFVAMGLAATGLGINAVVQNMPNSTYPVLFIASLALGGAIGAGLDLDGRFNRLVDKHSKSDDAEGAPSLGRGLSTAIMLFCVGTLSILGPINSALYGDETFLFTNAMLDLVTSMVLASTFGYGIAIAAGVLFLWQGGIYLMASFLAPLLSGGLMCEISIVGGFLIFASGLSILKIREISAMNLLPGLFIPPIWFALIAATGGFGGLLS